MERNRTLDRMRKKIVLRCGKVESSGGIRLRIRREEAANKIDYGRED